LSLRRRVTRRIGGVVAKRLAASSFASGHDFNRSSARRPPRGNKNKELVTAHLKLCPFKALYAGRHA
jgi:hypothetical protein